jgi:hypothetical protein
MLVMIPAEKGMMTVLKIAVQALIMAVMMVDMVNDIRDSDYFVINKNVFIVGDINCKQ